jgi:PEP-CTERM motif
MKSKSTPVNATLTSLGTLTALAATAHAATVQITLMGNTISSTSGVGDSLNADITGDSVPDLTFSDPVVANGSAAVRINGGLVSAAAFGAIFYRADAQFAGGGLGTPGNAATFIQSINYLNPITFTDSRINGGATTEAWLQVNASNSSNTRHTVALTRVIFNDASVTRPNFLGIPGPQTEFSAVPEPSGLALLALGAGGLLTRRKRQAA